MPAAKALSPELEERVKSLQGVDDAYKESMRQTLIANPDFAAGWLRQSDYDRNMNSIKSSQKEWFDKNNAEFATMQTQKTELERRAQEQAAQIKELETRVASGDYTPAQEAAMMKEVGTLKSTIETLNKGFENLSTRFVDRDTLGKEAQTVVSFVTSNIFELNDIQFDHQSAFNKPFGREDRQKLIDYAEAENKKGNAITLRQAYDSLYSKDIRAIEDKKLVDKALAEDRTRNNLPISGDVAPILGPVQARLQQGNAAFVDKLPENAPMDAVAAAAAASLRAEGKF